jgi:hypothetical protein
VRPDPRRQGVALLAALVVLAVAGTFLAAGYYAERASWERGLVSVRTAQLEAAAEAGILDVAAGWDSAARYRQPVGTTAAESLATVAHGATAWVWITRLSATSYWLTVRVADARDRSLAARAAALLHVAAPRFQTHGSADSSFEDLGGVALADLESRAEPTFAPGAVVWAPTGALMRAAGDLELTGGDGAGILLVDGTLVISGPVRFRGVIIARRGVRVTGADAVVTGLLLSGTSVVVNINASFALRGDSSVVEDMAWHAGRLDFAERGAWIPAP